MPTWIQTCQIFKSPRRKYVLQVWKLSKRGFARHTRWCATAFQVCNGQKPIFYIRWYSAIKCWSRYIILYCLLGEWWLRLWFHHVACSNVARAISKVIFSSRFWRTWIADFILSCSFSLILSTKALCRASAIYMPSRRFWSSRWFVDTEPAEENEEVYTKLY